MPGEHARLSPSAAHRWKNCPGSISLSEGIAETSSTYADEGTMLHTIVAGLLLRGEKSGPYRYIGNVEYTDLINDCLKVFWDRFDPSEDVAFIEQRVNFPHLPDVWGTADVIIVGKSRIEVIDWKFGRGVEVDAVENEQLEIYLLAAAAFFDFMGPTPLLLGTIFQPRLSDPKEWIIEPAEVTERLTQIKLAADRTRFNSTELHDGDWCKFCPAKAICPQLRNTAMVSAQAGFENLSLYTGAQVAEALDVIPRIQDWIAAIKGDAMRRLEANEIIGGYKLVEGKRSRAYVDVAVASTFAREALGNNGFSTPTLLTPAQLEKALKKIKLSLPTELIEWRPGPTHVAAPTDRRESIAPVALGFEVITTEERDQDGE